MATPNTFATPRDGNNVPAKLAVLNTDTIQGQNLVPIHIRADGHVRMTTTDSISFTMVPIDPRDPNFVGCWLFQGLDGKVYPAVANSNGQFLANLI